MRKWFKAGSQRGDASIRSSSLPPQSISANIPTNEPKGDLTAQSSSPPPATSPVASPAHASPTPTLPMTEEPRKNLQDGAIPLTGARSSRGMQAEGSSCKCSAPPPGKKSRNLVICIDGTANQFSMKNTNVVELYSRLHKDEEQLTYYNSGIGTFVKPSRTSPAYWKQTINHGIDTAIAWNFKRIVLSAYQWLCENYEPGDRIFLYGFSRGAYQVRVIAGMIEKVGLLHKGNNDQIPFAYELYMATTSSQKRSTSARAPELNTKSKVKSPKTPGYAEQLCSRFKQTLSRDNVRVHFVGVWDTVSSIGFARGKSLPETTTGMLHVCVFRHALALDEKRAKFQPELVNGGSGLRKEDYGRGDIKEVWFAGSHSDVGGGNITNLDLDQFVAALRWMSYESISHGLRMAPFQGSQWQSFQPNPSLTWVWMLLEILCFRQLSYKTADSTTHRPHLGRARQVKAGQMIHESVFELIEQGDYEPFARLPDDLRLVGWDRKALEDLKMLEGDAYASAAITLTRVKKATENDQRLSSEHQNALATLASSDIGRDSLATTPDAGDILFSALLLEHLKEDVDSHRRSLNTSALATAITAITMRPPASATYTRAEVRKLFSVLDNTPANQDIIASIMDGPFRRLRLCRGNQLEYRVSSVVFSPNGDVIASASDDGTIRIWNTRTGEALGVPFTLGYTRSVRSVAFSPDGTRVVSGSDNHSVEIWDAQTGQMVAGPFWVHQAYADVLFVAFSPDGTRVVSGWSNGTIVTWDAQGETVARPSTGDIFYLLSAALSPDGTRVVSSSNGEIFIWDAQTREMVTGPFKAHTNWIQSLSFSPDGRRVVSGSDDRTVRVWDAQTGEAVAGPFTGHMDQISSVAFSPDGKHIVSGSADHTVRIWDAQTGETVVGPLRGHTDGILSVTYSPDGKLVASGSKDGTVRIWDVEVDGLSGH